MPADRRSGPVGDSASLPVDTMEPRRGVLGEPRKEGTTEMAADDRTGSGSAWPGGSVDPVEGDPQASRPSMAPQQPVPPQESWPQAPQQSVTPQGNWPQAPQQQPVPPSFPGPPPTGAIPYTPLPYPPAGVGPPGFVQPPGYGPPPGPSPQPGYGPPGFVQPPGYSPQPGGWPGSPYPPFGWGYPPGFGSMPFVPAGPAPGLSWGGIGVRFGALLIDAILMGVTFVIATLLADAAGVRRYADDSVIYSSAATAIYWIWIIFFVAYHPACWYAFGSSLGQRALGLRVVRASDGLKLGLGAVLIRYVIFAVFTGTVILGIIAAAMANEDPFKRAWHDEAARSVVVRRS